METSGKVHQESHPFGGGFFVRIAGLSAVRCFARPHSPEGKNLTTGAQKKGKRKPYRYFWLVPHHMLTKGILFPLLIRPPPCKVSVGVR